MGGHRTRDIHSGQGLIVSGIPQTGDVQVWVVGSRVQIVAESSASSEQLESFGRAIATALANKGWTTGALLSVAGGKTDENKRKSVLTWMAGKVEPSRPKVLEIERILELEPGELSRHLGWVPVGAEAVPTVEAAILADPDLTSSQKNILLAALQDFRRG